jgi:phage anti-repressor protein
MKKEAKTLHWCLDGHSRSKMWLFMLSMRKVGMLKKEDLVGFSTELQNQIFPEENEKLS